MTRGSVAAVVAIVAAAIVAAWGAAAWRSVYANRATPRSFERIRWTSSTDPGEIDAALSALAPFASYRGLLPRAAIRGAHAAPGGPIELEVAPAEIARALLGPRGIAGFEGLVPSVARGRIEFGPEPGPPGGRPIAETWRLACPEGCLLDLIDRTPPPGSPSLGWAVAPPDASALAWFALDVKRLGEPTLGGEGLAPFRERFATIEQLLGRPIRAELGADLRGTGVFALSDPANGGGARVLLALDLVRADRVRELLDMVVSLAVLADRGVVRHHRGVTVAVLGAPRRGLRCAVAVDGPLLYVSDDPAAIEAAIDRRRSDDGSAVAPPAAFAAAACSWRMESTSPFVAQAWRDILGIPRGGPSGAPPGSRISAELSHAPPWWWLRGSGPAPAVTADPVLPWLRSWRGTVQRSED